MYIYSILVISMFVALLLLLLTGLPIPFVLAGVAMFFSLIGYLCDLYLGTMTGINFTTIGMLVNRLYALMANWTYVAIPMFIFMGIMLEKSKMAEKMMVSVHKLFGKIHGGLAVTVTIIGILLAASTGIVGASVVLLGIMTIPTMIKEKYYPPFAAGTVCASGTLGILIPPSIMLVAMADQLAISVGDLFMGALIPGIILGGLYITYILIYCRIKPEVAPLSANIEPLSWSVIFEAFKSIIPLMGLILLVLGTIFAGICTATEASALGALGAIFLAWINKKLSFAMLKNVVIETFSIMGYVFAIFIFADAFALILRMLGGDEVIGGFLLGLPFGPYGILFFIMLMVFFLGFFLDWMQITFIILPILASAVSNLSYPLVKGYGVIDQPVLIWFTILVAICLQTSFLTPPVGFSLFYLKGVCPPSVSLKDIFKGIIPFVFIQLIGLAIIIIWPNLVTWLPAVAYGVK
jgi:tripartite ATP-independent transporter DctM subunit